MLQFVYNLPLYQLVILSMAMFVGLAMGGVLLVCRFGQRWQIEKNTSDFGQLVGGPIGNVFALVFALVTIAIWENYDHVRNQVTEEAAILHNIYRNLETYPAAVRDPVQALLKQYVNRVVNYEWNILADLQPSHEDPEARRMITAVNATLVAYRPAPGDAPLQYQMLYEVSECRKLRRARLESGTPYMDPAMWICLDLGSLILLGYCSFWRLPSRREHLFMASALGASLGLIYFMLVIYNHPFAGPAAISPAPMQDLLETRW